MALPGFCSELAVVLETEMREYLVWLALIDFEF